MILLSWLNCSDWEDLKAEYSIATHRHGRFVDSLNGLDRTERDEEEATRLEDEMKEAERALVRHQAEHGCRGERDDIFKVFPANRETICSRQLGSKH